MGYPGRHNIYEATIRRMVLESLEQQEQEFRKEHEADSDQQLILYLKDHASRLNRSPWPGEIIGGRYIEERFGTWNQALLQAGLPAPCTRNDTKASARYQEEVEHQKVVYRQRKAEKKLRAQKRMAQKAAGKKNGGQSGSG